MIKKISVFIWLFLFASTLSAMAINNEGSAFNISKQKERQIPGFPGIPGVPGTEEPQFPRGDSLLCYVPYRVEIRDSQTGVIDIILVKKLKVKLQKQPSSHWQAVELLTQGRKQLWILWQKFKKDLENKDISSFIEITDSRGLIKEIGRKEMWSNDQSKLWQQINIGKPLNGEKTYPMDFPYSTDSEVVGLVVRYEMETFRPIYDMESDDSNKYWEFVTEYIRKYAIAAPDWDHPENDKDLPPIQFFYGEVNYE